MDDAAYRVEILVEQALAETATGVREERLDGAVRGRVVEAGHAVRRREVGFDRLRRAASGFELARDLVDLRLVGRDDEIVAVSGAAHGEFVADAGGCAGHDRQGATCVGHDVAGLATYSHEDVPCARRRMKTRDGPGP